MKTYVYFIKAGKAVKVGVAKNVRKRIKAIQTGNANKVKFVFAIPCESQLQAHNLEKRIHHWQRKCRIRGEWFSLDVVERFKKNIGHISGAEGKLITRLSELT